MSKHAAERGEVWRSPRGDYRVVHEFDDGDVLLASRHHYIIRRPEEIAAAWILVTPADAAPAPPGCKVETRPGAEKWVCARNTFGCLVDHNAAPAPARQEPGVEAVVRCGFCDSEDECLCRHPKWKRTPRPEVRLPETFKPGDRVLVTLLERAK